MCFVKWGTTQDEEKKVMAIYTCDGDGGGEWRRYTKRREKKPSSTKHRPKTAAKKRSE